MCLVGNILGDIWEVGEWNERGEFQCRSTQEELPRPNGTKAYPQEDSELLWRSTSIYLILGLKPLR